MDLFSTALTICLVCPPASDRASCSVDDILKAHGLPLFAAQAAHVEPVGREAGSGFWAPRLSRLVTTDFSAIYSEEEARKLAAAVLIYCTEPGKQKGWGDLALAAHAVGRRMALASPLLGYEGPLPLARPFQITLAHVDRHGRVLRTETHNIVELEHGPRPKQGVGAAEPPCGEKHGRISSPE
jgi:hypothetical protein